MHGKLAYELADDFGYLSKEEVNLLKRFSKKIPQEGVCVNIGAGTGTSSLAVLEERPDLTKTFYTIDIRNHDNPFGGLLNERNAFQKYDLKVPNQIHGDSKKVGKEWENGLIDFLIIDGDHTREGIAGDIKSWEKHLSDNAIIFIHDYQGTRWKYVTEVVNELLFDDDRYKNVGRAGTYVVFKFRKE
jgi:predicted O-methyltransferase YrrM